MSKQLSKISREELIRPPLTREKAIEILSDYLSSAPYRFDSDLRDALKLAIQDIRAQLVTDLKRGLR